MATPAKLAVIIATKNRSDLLAERSLPAIKHQSKKPDFLIISDDSDPAICAANGKNVSNIHIQGCKVLYTENHQHPGASGAWNSAVDKLLSEIDEPTQVAIAILDDDDSWSPHYLDVCHKTMWEQDLDMVACGINRIECHSAPAILIPAPEKLVVSEFLIGNPGIQGSNLFLRLNKFLEAGGFDEALNSSTDRDLCIRLAEMENLRYSAIPQYLVNHHAEADRERLSTPHSVAKLTGLTSLWQKYSSRMSNQQKSTFCHRALKLFGWAPPDANGPDQTATIKNKALVLVLQAEAFWRLQEKLIAFFMQFRDLDLVALDVVFLSKPEHPAQNPFTTALYELGVGCYPVESEQLIVSYSKYISRLRPGSNIWLLEQFLETGSEIFEDSEAYLRSCGAVELMEYAISIDQDARLDTQKMAENIHQLRVRRAEYRVRQHVNTGHLRTLGFGSEAIVFTNEQTVFKCIDYWKTRTPKAQFEFLHTSGPTWKNANGVYPLSSVVRDGTWVLLTYPYEKSKPYNGGCEEQLIQLINDCTQVGIVCNNIHPKNLIHTHKNVKLIDYGSDIRPWNQLGFEHMARRAYLSCRHAENPRLEIMMRQSLADRNMPELGDYAKFRAKLDYPVHNPSRCDATLLPAPNTAPFELIIGVITADPVMLLPLISSLRVFKNHPGIHSLSVNVLCNGCSALELQQLLESTNWQLPVITIISEQQQKQDAQAGLFGPEIKFRPNGQAGIAKARTMLQRYLGMLLAQSPGSIAWILDDDMRVDVRACAYISWLPSFREQGVDVLLGAYEGSSPNPPLNGLRVQLMDLVHNLAWLSKLPEESVLPDRTNENNSLRAKFPDYYYDLSRKHSAHLESPFWLQPSYHFETIREARARLIAGALGILNGTPLTRSIVAPPCHNPLSEAKDSVNRGGCTFILNHESVLHTPNLIPEFNGKEARRSDMLWAIINRYYRGMSIKAIPFPVYHVGRFTDRPAINAEKVQEEIIGSALYAGLTDFLRDNPEHRLNFSPQQIDEIHQKILQQLASRTAALKKSFYRISGLSNTLKYSPFGKELKQLTNCIEEQFTLTAYSKIRKKVQNVDKKKISYFLSQLVPRTEAYSHSLHAYLHSPVPDKECDNSSENISETTS